MINKEVRKSLARKKGNEILIWIWNDSNMTILSESSDIVIISCVEVELMMMEMILRFLNGEDFFDLMKLLWGIIPSGFKGLHCGTKTKCFVYEGYHEGHLVSR